MPPPLRHVMQPSGSMLCGQAVVAMVFGASRGTGPQPSLTDGIGAVGHSHTTKTRELIHALRFFTNATRLTTLGSRSILDLPYFSVLRVRLHVGADKGRFVLRAGPVVHDPLEAGPYPLDNWLGRIEAHGRVTSFIPLTLDPPLPKIGDEFLHPIYGRQTVESVNHDPSGIRSIFSHSTEQAADGHPKISMVISIRGGSYNPEPPDTRTRYDVLGE